MARASTVPYGTVPYRTVRYRYGTCTGLYRFVERYARGKTTTSQQHHAKFLILIYHKATVQLALNS